MFEMVKPALSFLWTDKCTITNTQTAKNTDGITVPSDISICTDEPCRISYKSIVTPNNGTDTAAERVQDITLFIRSDIDIPSGSKISVTRNGITVKYSNSGQPKLYDSHQEISLKIDEDKA